MIRGSMGGDFLSNPNFCCRRESLEVVPLFPRMLHKNADLNWTSFNISFCFCNCHHMHFASEIQSQPCFLTSIVANGVAGWRELPVRFLKVPAASVCASPQTRFVKLNNARE
jgi:hypothetical protein